SGLPMLRPGTFALTLLLSLLTALGPLSMDMYLRSEEHTSELQSLTNLVCRLLLEKKKKKTKMSRACCQTRPAVHTHRHPLTSALSVLFSPCAPSPLLLLPLPLLLSFFFFNDTATTEIYTLSLHDALPIFPDSRCCVPARSRSPCCCRF